MQTTPLITLCTWLARLAWLNLCWVGMTALGGVVFGIFPATTVTAIMLRRYLNGAASVKVRHVWACFKDEFVSVNKAGWSLMLPALSAAWYANWAVTNLEGAASIAGIALFPVTILLALMCLSSTVYLSFYQSRGVYHTAIQGLAFILEYKFAFFIAGLIAMACIGTGQFIPTVLALFTFTPALLVIVYAAWRDTSELQLT